MSDCSEQEQMIEDTLSFNFKDERVRLFWILQLIFCVAFVIHAFFLFHLPTVWTMAAEDSAMYLHSPNAEDNANTAGTFHSKIARSSSFDVFSLLAIDTWFALGLSAAVDAIAIVGTLNRSIIDSWHYFISVRMMAIASIVSFVMFTCGRELAMGYLTLSNAGVCLLACLTYIIIGYALDASHRPPPTRRTDPCRRSLQEYTDLLNRSNGSWLDAILATAVTGGLGVVLTVLISPDWSTIIPVITTGFEAVFLRFSKFRRTPQYTVCAAPIFQAGVCVHWGMKQVAMSSRLSMPSWAFLALVLSGRLVLDLHLRIMFRDCLDLLWARKHALVPTTMLVTICLGLLLLETMRVPILLHIKPVAVFACYFLSSLGTSAPAAYLISFSRIRSKR